MRSKTRGENFTPSEKNLLLKILQKFNDIVEDKCSNSGARQGKKKVWADVTLLFNQNSRSGYRSELQLRNCWKNIKARYKKSMMPVQSQSGAMFDFKAVQNADSAKSEDDTAQEDEPLPSILQSDKESLFSSDDLNDPIFEICEFGDTNHTKKQSHPEAQKRAREPEPELQLQDFTLTLNKNDEDTLFLLSMAAKMRKLDRKKSSEVKMQIMKLIHDAEFT